MTDKSCWSVFLIQDMLAMFFARGAHPTQCHLCSFTPLPEVMEEGTIYLCDQCADEMRVV